MLGVEFTNYGVKGMGELLSTYKSTSEEFFSFLLDSSLFGAVI